MKLHLGLVYTKNLDGTYRLVSHRSILKILINPLLRQFGYFINSVYDKDNDIIKRLELRKLPDGMFINIFVGYKNSIFSKLPPNSKVVKKRILY